MSKKAFAAWCAGFLAVCALLGVVLKVTQRDEARPEGVAERWLAGVSDTTRKGVGDDARRRVAELAIGEAAAPDAAIRSGFVTQARADELKETGKTVFTAIEVGRVEGGRVPFRASVREGEKISAVAVLEDTTEGWRVVGTDAAKPGEAVASAGGDPLSRAPAALWFGALAIAAMLTVGATGLVKLAGRVA